MSSVLFPTIAESYNSDDLTGYGHLDPDVGFFAILDAFIRENAAAQSVDGVSPGTAGNRLTSIGGVWAAHGVIGACAYSTATQAIPTGTSTALLLPSEHFDSDGFHDPVTNNPRLTVPVSLPGIYLPIATVGWGLSAATFRYLRIRKNGATWLPGSGNMGDANSVAGFDSRLAIAPPQYFANPDYVEAIVDHNKGSDDDTVYGLGLGSSLTLLYLGPA